MIEYGVSEGQSLSAGSGEVFIEVPETGVARISPPIEGGYANDRFYVGSLENENRIPHDPNSTESGIAVRHVGRLQLGNERQVKFFFVGTLKEFEDADSQDPLRMLSAPAP